MPQPTFRLCGFALTLLVLGLMTAVVRADALRVASTTSLDNSGLLAAILPDFTKQSGIKVHVIAVGTGQALRLGRTGDVDMLLVHHRPAEDRFVKGGHGIGRTEIMYNDFVLIGPSDDPAGIKGRRITPALRRLAARKALFLSRGDRSGTHGREVSLWERAGLTPWKNKSAWYREAGAGMGRTLNMAAELRAHTLTDRGTWLSFRNRRGLAILVAGGPALHNIYAAIIVNPKRHPHIRVKKARALIAWLLSPDGRRRIAAYKVNGELLFKSIKR
jgi:tungstate transport system substrate-binding protein